MFAGFEGLTTTNGSKTRSSGVQDATAGIWGACEKPLRFPRRTTMPVGHLAGFLVIKTQVAAVWLFQHEPSRPNLLEMWTRMLWPARTVAITLAVMSAWSVGVMLDRWVAF